MTKAEDLKEGDVVHVPYGGGTFTIRSVVALTQVEGELEDGQTYVRTDSGDFDYVKVKKS